MLESTWDDWLGALALDGVDPRRMDMAQLMAAYEVSLRRGAKDEAAWNAIRAQVYAEPKHVREERRAADRAAAAERPGGMRVDDAEAMLARFAASDAMFG